LDVFGCVASYLGKILQFFGLERERFLPRIRDSDIKILRVDLYRLTGGPHFEFYVDIALLSTTEADIRRFVLAEVRRLHRQFIGAYRNGSKGVIAFAVRGGISRGAGG